MELMKKFNPFKRHQLQQQFHHQQQLQQLTSTSLSQRDSSSKKKAATEKELVNLNQKIEKLLANLDENQVDGNFPEDEECVVCLSAKATMKTYPCGHRVVCRKCFVKTIQTAVAERCLPLKCVVCRTKILKLKQPRLSSSSEPLKHLRSADRVDEYRRCQRQQQQILLLPQHNPSTGSSSTTASAVSAAAGPANPVGASSTSVAATGSRSIFSSLGCAGTQRSGGHHHHQPQQPQQQHHQAAGSTGAVKPTATRLMQPLLIYPSQGTGDWRRHGTVGWPSRDDSPMPRTADTASASAAAAVVPATAGSRMFNVETRPSSAATRRRTKHPVGIDLQH